MSSKALLRRLLADNRGTVFIEYSSLALLLAIAAIAMFVQFGDAGVPSSHASHMATSG